MGIPILCIGKSGTGKSTSLRNFCADEVGVINVLGKPLPFKGQLRTVVTDDYITVYGILKNAKSKVIVIDDAGYLMTNQFMRGHSSTGKGNEIFAFYNAIADSFWKLIQYVIHTIPPEKTVYFMMHEDKNELGDAKPKSIGKMLDEKVCIEGMFTIVLRSCLDDGKYCFKTQSDGFDVCKSPMGMFEGKLIDNDLKQVDAAIRAYWEMDNNA